MGRPPQAIRAWLDRPVNALQLCCWKFSHKESLQQTFFDRITLLEEKWSICVFELPLRGLGATYAVHLIWLVGKLVVNFLLVIIELFFTRCKDWGATSEYRLEIAVFEAVGSVWPKIPDRRWVTFLTNHFSCRKTRWIDLSYYGVRMWTELSFVLSQYTRMTDGRTDGRTDGFIVASTHLHSCSA